MGRRAATLLRLLVLLAWLALPAPPARAASLDESASTLASNEVVDFSGNGRLAFALQLDSTLPVELAVLLEESEKAAPLVLELLLMNVSGQKLDSLALTLEDGATFADTGAFVADAPPSSAGITADATSALLTLPRATVPYSLELGDTPGGEGAGWRIDASGVATDAPFTLRVLVVPEPGTSALQAFALATLLALRRRRRLARGIGSAALAACLLLASGARAETRIVSDPVDGSFGSLRRALEVFADPGDTIVFQTAEVVLDERISVPPELDGLTIQGPVTIRPAAGLRGLFDILADGVTITGGVVFQDVQVATSSTGAQSGTRFEGNQFLGESPVFFSRDIDCVFAGNVMSIDLPPGSPGEPVSLFFTRGCRVEGNQITTDEWLGLQDFGSDELVIFDNESSAGIFSSQRSGRIEMNRAEFVFVIPNDGRDSEPLLVTKNTADWMRVHRTNVEVVENTVDATAGGGTRLAGIAMSLVNDDPRGGAGSYSARGNGITGGRVGILYSDADGEQVPGELLDNVIASCRDKGLFAARPKGTRILRNRVTGCGTAPGRTATGIGIKRAQLSPVLLEDSIVTGHGRDGITVFAPETAVIVRNSTIRDAAEVGLLIQQATGPRVEVEAGAVTGSGGPGLWATGGSRAGVTGGEYRNNGNAGILLRNGTLVSISAVGMSDNEGPGIDLFPAQVTPNEQTKTANADTDWPENLRLDVPSQKIEGSTLPFARVEGFRVEGAPRTGNPENGEGTLFQAAVTADASGHFVYPGEGQLDCPVATRLTFTATTADGLATSEFSPDFDCDEPPLDTDGDSVVDARDQCPDTPEGTPVDEDGCPLDADEDDDGVADAMDACPGTDPSVTVEGNGCGQNVSLDDGRMARCNDPATCLVGPAGGPCVDCAITSADGEDFDCFADGTSCAAPGEGGVVCLECELAAFGARTDCTGAECASREDSGAIVCEGPALGCETLFAGGRSEACPADRACAFVLDSSLALTDAPASFRVEKSTLGGDSEFEFDFSSELPAGDFVTLPIQTDSGQGTRILRAFFGVPEAFTETVWTETPPDGWELEEITCDAPTIPVVAGPREGVGVVFDPGDDHGCSFVNRRLPVSIVRTDLGVQLPEVLERSATFGLPPGNRVILSGANGFAIVDALTGDVPFAGSRRLSFVGPFEMPALGTVVMENPDGSGEDSWFSYSTGGTAQSRFLNDLNDFGFTQLGFNGRTDVHHDSSDPASPEAVGVDPQLGRVTKLFHSDEFSPGDFFLNERTLVDGFFLGEASDLSPISAYRFRDGSHLLIAMDGQPGELILAEPDEATGVPVVQVVGALGDSPRRIRCAAGVCAASNFASDSLSLITWDGAGTAAIVGSVAVGDGPVGISARPFGANVLFASTGFGDDTIWITEVAPDGSVVSNGSLPAPAGCVAPGHALWLRDAQESLVVSCNASDAYAVLTPGPLPPP